MTQLNLSGRQSNHSQQNPASPSEDESIKNQTVGALGALVMFAAVIVVASCSRSTQPSVAQQPVQPTVPVSTPAATPPAPVPPPVVAKTKKTRRAATLSYVNREYGLSFRFPRSYRLQTQLKSGNDNETQLGSSPTEPLPMNLVDPGGVMLAAVELPSNSYPGTNFKSGVLNVSVNPGMTSDACEQFALPEPGTGTSTEAKTNPIKLGAIEFHEVENPEAAVMKQADAKYYHVFGNGACYEFALLLDTDSDTNVEEITPVDRKAVFGKLEKILASVKLRPAVLPETETPAAQTPTPAVAVNPTDSPSTPERTSTHPSEKTPAEDEEKGTPVPNL